MQYQVFVQNLPDGMFSAFVLGFPDIVGKGATLEEAIDKANELLKERLAVGRVLTIYLEDSPFSENGNPWLETHGVLCDDPTFDDWVREIESSRCKISAGESPFAGLFCGGDKNGCDASS